MNNRKPTTVGICIMLVFSLIIMSTMTALASNPTIGINPSKYISDLQDPKQLMHHPSHPTSHSTNSQTAQETQYIIIDLAEATDPLGINNSEAVGINNNGEIVGFEELDDFKYQSIYWSQNGTASILENNEGDNSSRPYMIDDNGLILGWSASVWYEWIGEFKKLHMNQTAVTWKDKVVLNLNDGTTGGDTLDLYHARDNNDAGTIVGSGAPPGNIPPPWWPNGFIFDEGVVTDLGTGTYSYAINNQGHIAGFIDADYQHAYEWEDGSLIDLNDDPLIKANYSQAYDINDNDVIAGMAQFDSSLYWEPVVWKNHQAIRILPTSSQYVGYALAVNGHDEVVGYYDDLNSGISNAFLWKDGNLTILNDYLPTEQGWEFIIPDDINDYGQIVGFGYRTDIGYRAFLMTPLIPILDVETKGGVFITASLTNRGYAPATEITWNITTDGGLVILGKQTTGSIAALEAGDTARIISKPLIGFGKTTIIVNVKAKEGFEVTKSFNGLVLLFYTLKLK